VTDPEGHVTTYTVDRWGQPLVTTDPLGRVTTITRNGPLAVRVVYPSGAKDSAAYNGQGLMTYSAPAGQNPSTITYGAYALPTQISGTSQPTQTFKYGMHGRDSLVTVAGLTTHYYADMYGRDTAVTDPGGHLYKLHYDGTFGNLDSTLAAGTGQPVQYTRTTFDGYGRDSIERASGRVGDTTVYDSTNRVVRVAAPGHHVVTTAYDPLTYSDPFGLKVDLSGLDADERAKINALRKTSKTFERWYSAIDRIPADKLLLRVSTAKDGWVGMIQGAGDGKTFKSGQYANIILSSSANWASLMEFESVAAHEFAHAAAGLKGGTPSACYDNEGSQQAEDCAVTQQNQVHTELHWRERRNYGDVAPFSIPLVIPR
jgi:YD repeat-containing protein